jgi:uncharacterized FAD-dependent dehydrogenase
MKYIFRLLLVVFLLVSQVVNAQTAKYKCNLQMVNYDGKKAYIVVSLVDAKNNHVKTLYMMGKEEQWYDSLKDWEKSQRKKPENLSAITGASIGGGARTTISLSLDESLINKGYKIKFESAVEDEKHYATDVVVPYTTKGIVEKVEGKGYIRFVKLSKL